MPDLDSDDYGLYDSDDDVYDFDYEYEVERRQPLKVCTLCAKDFNVCQTQQGHMEFQISEYCADPGNLPMDWNLDAATPGWMVILEDRRSGWDSWNPLP